MYDPSIIEEYAERLLRAASSLVALWTVIGAVLASAATWIAANAVEAAPGYAAGPWVAMVIGGVFGGAIGLQQGRQKAFTLRLQAQQALCQLRIEQNTRGQAAGTRPHAA